MKGWTTALRDGQCSYEYDHRFKAGDRVFRVGGPAGWTKDYCEACGKAHHGAGDETPVFPVDRPSGAAPMRPLRGTERFDWQLAAAGKDSE